MLNLLNDLLDMSQVKAGKFKLALESFSILELLREVKRMMQPLANHKSNVIILLQDSILPVEEMQLIGDTPPTFTVTSDKYRLR